MSPSETWLTNSYTRQRLIYTRTRSDHVERISNYCSRLWMSSSIERKRQNYRILTLILISLTNSVSTLWKKFQKNLDLNPPKSPEIKSKHVEKDTNASMTSFTPATISEFWKIIGKFASKSCSSDLAPT